IRMRPFPLVLTVSLVAGVVLLGYVAANRALRPAKFASRSSSKDASSRADIDDEAWYADPRLTCDTPWKNVRPEVKYVGDKICSECHELHSKTFREHPMGRSAFLPNDPLDDEPLDEKHHNPFVSFASRHLVRRENGEQWHDVIWLDPADPTKVVAKVQEHVVM